jgi:hypothetical protein
MNEKEIDDQALAKWDPEFTKLLANLFASVVKRWFRAEVRGPRCVPGVGRRRGREFRGDADIPRIDLS